MVDGHTIGDEVPASKGQARTLVPPYTPSSYRPQKGSNKKESAGGKEVFPRMTLQPTFSHDVCRLNPKGSQ